MLKWNFTNRNIYTLEESYRVLGLEDKVTVIPAGGMFQDWDTEFDKVYCHPKAGSVYKNHFFSFENYYINDMLLTTKVADNSSETTT